MRVDDISDRNVDKVGVFFKWQYPILYSEPFLSYLLSKVWTFCKFILIFVIFIKMEKHEEHRKVLGTGPAQWRAHAFWNLLTLQTDKILCGAYPTFLDYILGQTLICYYVFSPKFCFSFWTKNQQLIDIARPPYCPDCFGPHSNSIYRIP